MRARKPKQVVKPHVARRIAGRQRLFIRNFDAWGYLEIFLVSAIASVLAIRLFLQLTGYPQLGGRGLHIAHMLWGGFLMLASNVILLAFVSRTSQRLAAVLGGVGFGTFIDEIGKFVTSDNDYFFQPAVALIYLVFIATYMLVHTIRTSRVFTPDEYLVNALRELEEVAMHDVTAEERARALRYLANCDPEHPLVPALRRVFSETPIYPPGTPWWFDRVKIRLAHYYRRVASLPVFPRVVTLFFVFQVSLTLIYTAALVFTFVWRDEPLDLRFIGRIPGRILDLPITDAAQLVSSLASAGFALSGILKLRRSRRAAFEMFERSLLVSIFVTRVFSFYEQQFGALVALTADILALIAVRYVIEQERLSATQAARSA